MPKLRFSAESKDDLKEIARYIANDKPSAAREWVKKIKEKCYLLASHPDIGDMRPELGDGIRNKVYVRGKLRDLFPAQR